VLVLCLNLGITYNFHCRRKGKRVSKWLGFLVDVRFWSALILTLNQRAWSLTECRLSRTLMLMNGLRCAYRWVSVLSVISAMIFWRDSILAIFSIPNR
jgi:hypothetical protein